MWSGAAAAALAVMLVVSGCGSSGPGGATGGGGGGPGAAYPTADNTAPAVAPNIDDQVPAAALAAADRCDALDASECLFPFPNDYFTVADTDSATGRRVHFNVQSMPRSRIVLNAPANPAEWNRNDGFSPGSAILLHVDGVDLAESGAPAIGDLPRSLEADSPVVLIDAATLERQPCWAELDANASDPTRQALIIHPAAALLEGHRYIVALRALRNSAGDVIQAPAYFRIFRDNHISGIATVGSRREHMESIFETLGRAGVARGNLYLAWDFIVASRQDLTGRLLHIRDDAFKHFAGAVPKFSITKVTNYTPEQNAKIIREVQGTVTVPSYLTLPGSQAVLDPITRLLQGLTGADGALPIPQLQDLFSILGDQDLPLARFHYDVSTAQHPDALPARIPGTTLSAPFTFIIPRSVVAGDGGVQPARISLYGHGLFGSRSEVTAGNVEDMANEHDFVFCATNWLGFSQGDLPNALLTLLNISNAPSFFDIQQQGVLNVLVLGRVMLDPRGLASQPAFQVGSRAQSVLNTGALYYDGNSQGGIMGGTVVAVSQDVHRAVLGVTGMDYANLLLQRSSDFAQYAPLLYAAYPDTLDQQLTLGLLQMLWDRADPDGYAEFMTNNPLPDTPAHAVLMQVAWGDHQVSMWSAQMEARSIGAAAHCPILGAGRAVDPVPYFGIPCIPADMAAGYPGSALVVWDSGPHKVDPPPHTNTAPNSGHDPHEDVRKTPAARQQKSVFLRPGGTVVDVCDGRPCGALGYQPP